MNERGGWPIQPRGAPLIRFFLRMSGPFPSIYGRPPSPPAELPPASAYAPKARSHAPAHYIGIESDLGRGFNRTSHFLFSRAAAQPAPTRSFPLTLATSPIEPTSHLHYHLSRCSPASAAGCTIP